MNRQTSVKTLPCPKLRLRAVIILSKIIKAITLSVSKISLTDDKYKKLLGFFWSKMNCISISSYKNKVTNRGEWCLPVNVPDMSEYASP